MKKNYLVVLKNNKSFEFQIAGYQIDDGCLSLYVYKNDIKNIEASFAPDIWAYIYFVKQNEK